jgi:hypothetical protein
LVLGFIRHHIDWRTLGGAEMTWLLYEQYLSLIPNSQKRRFFTETEDWAALRAFDAGAFGPEFDDQVGG